MRIGQGAQMFYVADMQGLPDTEPRIEDLFRSENVVVRRVTVGEPDRWVVTFDNYGIGRGFDRPGFGQDWLCSQGISAIHVMGAGEDWYQYKDTPQALAAVHAAVAGATRVVTYGSSMGGYAAVRFADAVGAHAALGLSPQYTLDPAVAAHDARWSQDVSRIAWIEAMNGPLTCAARAVVLYDPCGLDGWHARRIAAEIDAILIALPHTAHPVATFLSEVGLLGDLLKQVLADDLDAAAFRREARARKRMSGVYVGELAARQPPRRSGLALDLARQAVAANPGSPYAQVSLARLLGRQGLHDEALAILESVVQASNRAVVYLVDQGDALALAGRTAEARAVIAEVLGQVEGVAHIHGWAASVCWMNGDTDEARRLIASASRLDPGNPHYRATADLYDRRPSVLRRVSNWALRRRESLWKGVGRPGGLLSSPESATGS